MLELSILDFLRKKISIATSALQNGSRLTLLMESGYKDRCDGDTLTLYMS
jgi:hypothetical protein